MRAGIISSQDIDCLDVFSGRGRAVSMGFRQNLSSTGVPMFELMWVWLGKKKRSPPAYTILISPLIFFGLIIDRMVQGLLLDMFSGGLMFRWPNPKQKLKWSRCQRPCQKDIKWPPPQAKPNMFMAHHDTTDSLHNVQVGRLFNSRMNSNRFVLSHGPHCNLIWGAFGRKTPLPQVAVECSLKIHRSNTILRLWSRVIRYYVEFLISEWAVAHAWKMNRPTKNCTCACLITPWNFIWPWLGVSLLYSFVWPSRPFVDCLDQWVRLDFDILTKGSDNDLTTTCGAHHCGQICSRS